MTERAHDVAMALLGTCDSLDKHASDAEENDQAFLSRLDEIVAQCTLCGWWVDAEEIDADGVCAECRDE